MAIVITQEESLLRKKRQMRRESSVLSRLVYAELVLGTVFTAWGGWVLSTSGGKGPLIGGIALLFLGFGHFFKIRDNRKDQQNTEAGRHGEKLVSRLLAAGLSDRYYVLNDVMVIFGRKSAQIDHIVLSTKGIFILETKNWRGTITGDEKDFQWKQLRTDGSAPVFLHNPVEQNARHVQVLRKWMKSKGLPELALVSIIVMTNRGAKWTITNQEVPVVSADDLVDFIGYHPDDAQVPWPVVQQLAELLTGQVIEEKAEVSA